MVKGLLERFFGKKKKQLVTPDLALQDVERLKTQVQALHAGLYQQHQHIQAWHNYLHSSVLTLQNDHKDLKERHNMHYKDLKESISAHNSEISGFRQDVSRSHHMHNTHKEQAESLKNELTFVKKEMLQAIQNYHGHMLELHKKVAQLEEKQAQTVKMPTSRTIEAPKEVKIEQKPHFSQANVQKPTQNGPFELTPSEKEIIAVLLTSDKKYSYKDLGVECNKSPSTVKTQINTLKGKGVPIAEYVDADGSKRYYIPAEVKKTM